MEPMEELIERLEERLARAEDTKESLKRDRSRYHIYDEATGEARAYHAAIREARAILAKHRTSV